MDGSYQTGPTGMKETPEDVYNREKSYGVAAEELRAFVERIERLQAEARDLKDDEKEVFAELKGRGYCAKTVRKVIAERKKDANDRAEESAIFDLYAAALGLL